jgi:hypothetical protein
MQLVKRRRECLGGELLRRRIQVHAIGLGVCCSMLD